MKHNLTLNRRRGAALIIALVLLAVIAIIASTALTQIVRNRQEVQRNLIRQQADLLLRDALRTAEVQRQTDIEFSGETITLPSEQQPFGGTYQVTTQYQNDRFTADVEYRNQQDKVIYQKRE